MRRVEQSNDNARLGQMYTFQKPLLLLASEAVRDVGAMRSGGGRQDTAKPWSISVTRRWLESLSLLRLVRPPPPLLLLLLLLLLLR